MRTATVKRYLQPLREGGSLPAIVEADDGRLYVAKFRGAGQGPKALVAEVIAGTLAAGLGLQVPELAVVELDAGVGRNEPDPEIRDLLLGSVGANLGMVFLSGAVTFDRAADPPPAGALASRIVVFDAFIGNVDRTPRNSNLLRWRDGLWLIDHGASFVFLHGLTGAHDDVVTRAASPFAPIRDHVLLPWADAIPAAGAALVAALDDELLARALAEVPDPWLDTQLRPALATYLAARRERADIFLAEAQRARGV